MFVQYFAEILQSEFYISIPKKIADYIGKTLRIHWDTNTAKLQ